MLLQINLPGESRVLFTERTASTRNPMQTHRIFNMLCHAACSCIVSSIASVLCMLTLRGWAAGRSCQRPQQPTTFPLSMPQLLRYASNAGPPACRHAHAELVTFCGSDHQVRTQHATAGFRSNAGPPARRHMYVGLVAGGSVHHVRAQHATAARVCQQCRTTTCTRGYPLLRQLPIMLTPWVSQQCRTFLPARAHNVGPCWC